MAYCDDCGRHLNCDMESAEVKGCVFKEDRAGCPSSVAPQEGEDRIKLTTKGGQSIPSLKGVSRLNMDLIETAANSQLDLIRAEDKKEIERLKRNFIEVDEAKAVLDLSWCAGCEGRLRPKDAPVDAECSDICPLNSLLPKLKAIVSQTDKEVKP